MDVGIIVIGDEILSGYRKDTHLANSIALLGQFGHRLRWSLFIGDEPPRIIESLKGAHKEDCLVFCFGGIGATPDDHTRQCAANAFGLDLLAHPEALALIEQQFGESAYPKRILMAELPKGAKLIPNPVNNVPGFSVGDVHFLPGFPQMAQPMMQWVLEQYPSDVMADQTQKIIRVTNGHESEFIDAMQKVMDLGEVSISSLPVIGKEKNYVDFVIAGEYKQVVRGGDFIIACANDLGVDFEILE